MKAEFAEKKPRRRPFPRVETPAINLARVWEAVFNDPQVVLASAVLNCVRILEHQPQPKSSFAASISRLSRVYDFILESHDSPRIEAKLLWTLLGSIAYYGHPDREAAPAARNAEWMLGQIEEAMWAYQDKEGYVR